MRRIAPLLLVLLSFPLVVGLTTDSEQRMEIEAIRETVNHYLAGHATGIRDTMALAFHDSARLQFVRDGAYTEVGIDQYLSGMRGQPPADEADRERRIVSIDYTGNAAVAKVELDYPNAYFIDYMSLLKIDGEWKIANKIFHVAPR